ISDGADAADRTGPVCVDGDALTVEGSELALPDDVGAADLGAGEPAGSNVVRDADSGAAVVILEVVGGGAGVEQGCQSHFGGLAIGCGAVEVEDLVGESRRGHDGAGGDRQSEFVQFHSYYCSEFVAW